MISRIAALFALLLAGEPITAQRAAYRPAGEIALGAPDKWDYVIEDPATERVYIAHGDRLTVVDGRAGRVLGEITGIAGGTHGTALAGTPLRGFTDDGKAGDAIVFDPATMRVTGRIHADVDADGIAFDPASGHVFVVNGDPATLTVIEPDSARAIATIPLGEKPEYAAADSHGALFVAGEEKGDLIRIDTRTNAVTAHWPAPDCVRPHGVAVDSRHERVFLGCVNSKMIVMDGVSGRVVADLPIGRGSDATAFDPVRQRVFSANGGDGTISVYRQLPGDRYKPLAAIQSRASGRTMAVDPHSGRLFVAAGTAQGSVTSKGKPAISFGSLHLVMFDPAPNVR